MNTFKLIGNSFRLLFKNPIIFLLYLPSAIIGLIILNNLKEVHLATILPLFLASFIIGLFVTTFVILNVSYSLNNQKVSFSNLFKLSLERFPRLILATIAFAIATSIIAGIAYMIIIFVGGALIFLGLGFIADLIVSAGLAIILALIVVFLLIKAFAFFQQSCILKGGLGFEESWALVNFKKFWQILLLIIIYGFISFFISLIPNYIGSFLSILIAAPIIIIAFTVLYYDYLKK